MPPEPPVFGEMQPDRDYRSRPGSYAVLADDAGCVAVIQTATGLYLPGGGSENGESVTDTLHREVSEECGWPVKIVRDLGFAIEYVFAEGEGWFRKECSFFEVRRNETEAARETAAEEGSLVWLTRQEARQSLKFASQRWAVSQ